MVRPNSWGTHSHGEGRGSRQGSGRAAGGAKRGEKGATHITDWKDKRGQNLEVTPQGTGREMSKTVAEDGKRAQVICSFCAGKGKDPFGIMSSLSACSVCGGRGAVEVRAPYTPCAHCEGTGAVKRLTCTVCRGTGFVPAPTAPTIVCPKCKGAGDDASAPAMACLRCRGRGRVSAEAAP